MRRDSGADHSPITVAGYVMNANGSFKLLTQDHTYILKGHENKLFGPLPHTFAVCANAWERGSWSVVLSW